MTRYKSEIFRVSYKFITSSINEDEAIKLNELIEKRSSEGWELVTYSFMGGSGGDIGKGILITYKRD